MKKLILTALTVVGLAAGVFAQGYFQFDMNSINNGIAVDTAGSYLASGPFNWEAWILNGTPSSAQIGAIDAFNGQPGGSISAYALLASDGFIEQPLPPVWSFAGGTISLSASASPYKMAGVIPVGAQTPITLAIVAWNTSASSFNAMLAGANASTRAGVLAYSQLTTDYASSPIPNPPATGWPAQDLILTTVPEPSVFALAGLGAAALLIFRRRK